MSRVRLVVPLVLVTVVLAAGTALFLARADGPSDGTVVALSDRLAGPRLVISAVLDRRSRLEPGDVVVAIDGQRIDRVTGGQHLRPGRVLTYSVERRGKTVGVPVTLGGRWPTLEWLGRDWSALLLAASMLGMAVVVFRRRPQDPAAGSLLAIATFGSVGVPAFALGGQVIDLASGQDLWWCAFGELCLALMWASWLLFVLVFPRPVAGVPVVRVCAGLLTLVYVIYLVVALPTAASRTVAEWRIIEITFADGYVLPAAIVVCVVARFVVATDASTRRYLGWLVAAFAFGGAGYYFVWQLPVTIRGTPILEWDLVPLAFLPCVATLGAAVLRFGLFDIKAVARRAVVYTTLSFAVVVIYVGIVLAAGSLVTTGPLLAPPLVATVVIAVLAQPVKDRVQRSVSRLLYGTRDEPYVALSRLGQQLEITAVGDAVLTSVSGTVADALKLPYVATELCSADGTVLRRAEAGLRPVPECLTLPAVSGGLLVGRLLVAPRASETEFAPSELRLLTDLVRHAAPTLQALQLTVELKASRQHLVSARAEERRRIQRDLHDGIGPGLAGLRMQIGAVRSELAAERNAAAASTLAEIEQQVVQCAAEVRQLLTALRSPVLDSLGLVGALRYQAHRLGVDGSLAITVHAPDSLPRLPAAVEEAALAIASEAMTNAARHARAHTCHVALTIDRGIAVTVSDDGCGIPQTSKQGIGTHSMRQRADELGGHCRIRTRPTGGTEVHAEFPLGVTQ